MNLKYFVGFALWLLPSVIWAQVAGSCLDSAKNEPSEQRDGRWVIDSTWYYLGSTFGQYWFNNEQYRVNQRDQYGNMIHSLTKQYDTIALSWNDKSRSSAVYQDSITLEKRISEIWDAKADTWKMSDSVFYNSKALPAVSWYKTWNPEKSRFSGGKRIVYDYDENENMILENIWFFDTLSGNWANGQIITSVYNSENLLIQELLQTWDTAGFWRDSVRFAFTYNDNKNLIQEIQEIKNQNQQWENWSKWEGNYNTNGLIREEYRYGWESGIWKKKTFALFSYNGLLLTQILRKVWDDYGMNWIDKNRTTYTYNEIGLTAEVLGEYYDQYANIWYKSYTYSYLYDGLGHRTEYIYRIWDELNGQWLNYFKSFNYWSELASFAVNEINIPEISIFPNPSTGEINLRFPGNINSGTVYLLSQDGQLVLNHSFSGDFVKISSALTPGSYVLTVKTEKGIKSRKIIIR